MNDVVDWIAGNAIALAALLISIAAFAAQFFHGRKALLSVHLAKTHDYKGKADRLVIVNHGPAAAKSIRIAMTDPAGGNWKPFEERDNPFPIGVLAAGSAFYVPIKTRYDDGPYATANLTWADKRWQRQSWTSAISTTGYPLGAGQSPASLHAENSAKMLDTLRAHGI